MEFGNRRRSAHRLSAFPRLETPQAPNNDPVPIPKEEVMPGDMAPFSLEINIQFTANTRFYLFFIFTYFLFFYFSTFNIWSDREILLIFVNNIRFSIYSTIYSILAGVPGVARVYMAAIL